VITPFLFGPPARRYVSEAMHQSLAEFAGLWNSEKPVQGADSPPEK